MERNGTVSDAFGVWQVVIVLSLKGLIPRDLRIKIGDALAAWAAYLGANKNKTYAAARLGQSRRWIRERVTWVESRNSDFPETIRRVLIESPEGRPTASEIATELISRTPGTLEEIVGQLVDPPEIEPEPKSV